jgi:hypothetical protein
MAPPFLISSPDGREWSASRPGRFLPPGKSSRYPLYSRLGGRQSRSGRSGEEKILLLLSGIEIQPSMPSLYRLIPWLIILRHYPAVILWEQNKHEHACSGQPLYCRRQELCTARVLVMLLTASPPRPVIRIFCNTVKPVLNGLSRVQNIFPLKPGFRLI